MRARDEQDWFTVRWSEEGVRLLDQREMRGAGELAVLRPRDGGGHFRAVIVSPKFEGLSRIKAQQLVYSVVDDWMGQEIHALSMKTFTPEAWSERDA